MSDILGIAEISMNNDIQQLNIISHNIANAETAGYKRDMAVVQPFEKFLTTNGTAGSELAYTSQKAQQPNITGVTDYRMGSIKYTGNALDVVIEGDGFFEVTGTGGKVYTRDGRLALDASGKLVTKGGLTINGTNGEIRLTTGSPFIDRQGSVWEGDQMVGQIKIVHFENPGALVKLGGGLFRGNGGVTVNSDQVSMRQGHVEASNVVTMDEMVNMISTMRHFETGQKVIKSYDDILDTAIRTLGDL